MFDPERFPTNSQPCGTCFGRTQRIIELRVTLEGRADLVHMFICDACAEAVSRLATPQVAPLRRHLDHTKLPEG